MHIYGSQQYPSVTYILGQTKGKREVIAWAKRKEAYEKKNGKGSWDSNAQNGRDRGTAIHNFMDLLIKHGERALLFVQPDSDEQEFDNETIEMMQPFVMPAFRYWEKNIAPNTILEAEQVLICNSLRYGGKSDLLIQMPDGKIRLVDYKTHKGYPDRNTGKMIYRWQLYDKRRTERSKSRIKWEERDPWECIDNEKCREAFLQMMMYGYAYQLRRHKPYTPDEYCIAVISPIGVQEVVLPVEAHNGCLAEIKRRVTQFYEKVNWETELHRIKKEKVHAEYLMPVC